MTAYDRAMEQAMKALVWRGDKGVRHRTGITELKVSARCQTPAAARGIVIPGPLASSSPARYGCIGAWVVHELVADGHDGRHVRPLDRPAPAPAPARRAGARSGPARRRRHRRPRRARARARRARDHERDPPRGAAGAVLPRRPAARRARERARHRQRLRGGPTARRPDGARRLRLLDRRVRRARGARRRHDGPPGTLYGVFKRANESTASVYRAENGVSSIGLRPHTVYGVGRDQGLTSAPTTRDARRGRRRALHDPLRRRAPSSSTRATSPARSSPRASPAHEGASVHNLPGPRVAIAEVVEAIAAAAPESAGSIDFDDVRAAVPRGGRQRLVRASSCPASPRRRSTTASRRPSTASARSSPRGSSSPCPRSEGGAMSNRAFRDDWAERFGRPSPKIVCVGLNYTRPRGRVGLRAAEGAAPVRQVREHARAATATRSCCRPGVGHVDAEAELAVVIGATREPRAGERRARRRRRLHVRERRQRARRPVRRRPVVPRQGARHVLPGRPARRAAPPSSTRPTCASSSA